MVLHHVIQELRERTRPMVQDGEPQLAGRKSAAAEAAADAAAKAKRRKARKDALAGNAPTQGAGSRTKFSRSAAVFGQLQDRAEAAAAGVDLPAKARQTTNAKSSKALKL